MRILRRLGPLALALLLTGASCSITTEPGTIRLRVRNTGDLSFDSVRIGFASGSVRFDAVVAGETSRYRFLDRIHRYGSITAALEDGRTLRLGPIDGAGEAPLPPGEYTYDLAADGDSLRAELRP